ncbi:MAG: PEP/pyruvate-binding domain-containing protein [Planctomycetota bacterium]
MPADHTQLSTGLFGLDQVFQGLRPGDNVVFQVDSISDYAPFVKPYCTWAKLHNKRLIYLRFAKHESLVPENSHAEVHQIHPEEGFEKFIAQVHNVIESVGRDAYYVMDALSELTLDQYSDRMLGNFYMLTCTYLFSLRTVAYCALLKNYHSFHAASPIADTTQILVDVYRLKDKLYVHPRKVKHRYSPTMHMLHVWEGENFLPVTESTVISEVLTSAPWSGLNFAAERLGGWTRTFMQAEETQAAFRRNEVTQSKVDELFRRCLKMAISRNERTLALAEKYLTLDDVLEIKKRMLSSGMIGGKSIGMILARAVLKKSHPRWNDLLEPHDSFFIPSEVFYTFLVHNQCWRLRQNQKNPKTFLEGAEEARQRMLMGTFPDYMRERFTNMLDYYGLSPIIVRSSSLLEDSFGNAFAGKCESVFCANQGPRHIRLDDFISAVRQIYASSMSEEALTYRAERGILENDDDMALLVQRVSGIQYGSQFFPQIAGVGFSFNPYVWDKNIDPKAGLLRLVFGLGTRAVERVDDDYTRIVALNAPTRRPETNFDETRRYSQRWVDMLDLETNSIQSREFVDMAGKCAGLPIEMFASKDEKLARLTEERNMTGVFPWVLTFEGLLANTSFATDMREMLQILQDAYGCPVDIEFTLNFVKDGHYKINLLQCRPLQIKGCAAMSPPPELSAVPKENVVLRAQGAVIGQSRLSTVDRLIYVSPAAYSQLNTNDRYAIAHVIGQLTHLNRGSAPKVTLLLGPGRWGTSTPALGVPVTFREIQSVSIICEIVAMHDNLIPDVSLGTHFFSDFIESDTLYVALFPNQKDNFLNNAYFDLAHNKLARLLPAASKWSNVIHVIDPSDSLRESALRLYADTLGQKMICYVEHEADFHHRA